jgi:hypothetical protein
MGLIGFRGQLCGFTKFWRFSIEGPSTVGIRYVNSRLSADSDSPVDPENNWRLIIKSS